MDSPPVRTIEHLYSQARRWSGGAPAALITTPSRDAVRLGYDNNHSSTTSLLPFSQRCLHPCTLNWTKWRRFAWIRRPIEYSSYSGTSRRAHRSEGRRGEPAGGRANSLYDASDLMPHGQRVQRLEPKTSVIPTPSSPELRGRVVEACAREDFGTRAWRCSGVR